MQMTALCQIRVFVLSSPEQPDFEGITWRKSGRVLQGDQEFHYWIADVDTWSIPTGESDEARAKRQAANRASRAASQAAHLLERSREPLRQIVANGGYVEVELFYRHDALGSTLVLPDAAQALAALGIPIRVTWDATYVRTEGHAEPSPTDD